MKFDADALPGFCPSIRHAYDRPSLTVFPSTSSLSLSSDASSQSDVSFQSDVFSQDSDSSSISSHSDSDPATCEFLNAERSSSRFVFGAASLAQRVQRTQPEVGPELRQHPRRTAAAAYRKPRCPPTLVRQSDRKVNFVDSLVDSSTQIVEAIWPLSSVVCRSELGNKAVLPLRTFIQETLRRSRTSYSTLQVALYYLILIKPHVPRRDFTMEQLDDRCTDRALQCGRRMFLAALILASKYLQDRNYSARAWSKISGLNTQEINQNEIAFLLAVNWKLHITDQVFQRWTDIVLKYTPPPSPPSPGGISPAVAQQTAHWRHIILGLNSELTNIESLIPSAHASSRFFDMSTSLPRSILNIEQGVLSRSMPMPDVAAKPCLAPMILEPMPILNGCNRLVPSLGNLSTPRFTPQSGSFCTPAASAAARLVGKSSSMGMAMLQADGACAAQYLDRIPMSMTSSPQVYCPLRRSSLAASVSTASSPESMVSDMSRTSRSSSASSASSLLSANANAVTSVLPRFRASRLKAKPTLKLTVPSVPEDYGECRFTSSPECYSGPDGRLGEDTFKVAQIHRQRQLEDMVRDPASDAARTLQDLHSQNSTLHVPHLAQLGRKRSSEMMSMDGPLHENVRNMLNGGNTSAWPTSFLSSQTMPEMSFSARKRLCCASEVVSEYEAIGRPRHGMWQGILN